MKTILITGASSGIGKETAKLFVQKGWKVIATMRSPEKEEELTSIPGIHIIPLDVTSETAIAKAIDEAQKISSPVDVVVNNAGYAFAGAFEWASEDQIKRQFDVNVFGLMAVTRHILPLFRKQKKGTIINIASVAGQAAFPSFSLYNSTKFAVEGFSEALSYELAPLGIKVRIVEPGPIKTDFYGRSMDSKNSSGINDYNSYMNSVLSSMDKMGNNGLPPARVAKTIYKAAVCNSSKLHFPVGIQAASMIWLKHVLPNRWFRSMVKMVLK